ncbi:hypothetical protein AWN90_13615 [Nocardia terpenica]|uniref:Recombinase domain-containing protein n=1 Tax=Nocardia terpenica TaxID=455432 RepID=A0A164HUC7_9NOCA|nr:hypothetical protein AWN90_13615 [Nocardia terpenica]
MGWAIDVDVSRSVDPFDTPELGQWFKEEKLHDWDKVVCWKLDRLATGSIYLNKLIAWCGENNKTIASVTESFDLSNWVGRMIANVIAGVAEGELEAIKERTRGSYNKLLETGRWPGGTAPYGHVPEKTNQGWVLVADPPAVKVIDRMATQAIDGNSIDWIRDELNHDKITSPADRWRELKGLEPKGGEWNSKAIWNTLTNKSLLGHATKEGETVRDAEGMPVLYGDPILTRERWNELQDALDKRRQGPQRTRSTSPGLGVVFCFDCSGQLMHKQMKRDYGKTMYRYYHCINKDCSNMTMMLAEQIESMLEESFITDLGDEQEVKRIFIRASDHSQDLAEALEAADELATMFSTVKSVSMKNRLREQMAALDSRIATLEAMPIRPAGFEYQPTGRTYGEAWADAHTPEDKRQLLLKYGIKCRVAQRSRGTGTNQAGVWDWDMDTPEDLTARMAS